MIKETKFRLIAGGKVVGYERHSNLNGDAKFISIMHSTNDADWYNIIYHPEHFINAESKDQFLGMTDKNNVDIYERDILGGGDVVPGVVVYDDGSYRLNQGPSNSVQSALVQSRTNRLEMLGNVHEHQYILEQEDFSYGI